MTVTTAYRKLTQAELVDEARARFGDDPLKWAFRCPSCGDVATAQDFKDASAALTFGLTGQECIGRTLGAMKKPKPTNSRGCDWAAYGLIRGPWEVVMPPTVAGMPEKSVWAFPLADGPVPA